MNQNKFFITGLATMALIATAGSITAKELRDKAPTVPEARTPVVYKGAYQMAPIEPIEFRGNLRDLPKVPGWKPGDPIRDVPDKFGWPVAVADPANPTGVTRDPLLAQQENYDAAQSQIKNHAGSDLSSPLINLDGISFQALNPSDPVIDVGPQYVITAANGDLVGVPGGVFKVYNKVTGAVVAGPTKMALLITQVGTPCASPAGFSDPIVMYDEIGDRWMMAEIGAAANNVVCMYVSMTNDPVAGGWWGYAIPTIVIPDYPKFGIWSDGYYMTTNENLADGSAIYAIDRDQIMLGGAITPQRTIPAPPSLSGFSFQAFTPADVAGSTPPPAGSPNFLVRHRDDEVHGGANDPSKDFLELWEYDVDFLVPANTTITGPIDIPVAEFSSHICGLSAFECFRQPGTSVILDPLRELIMYRWVYRNFGTHEVLLGNLVTDLNPGNNADEHGGIRWIELRRPPAGAWSLYQEGTWGIDDDDRWMGASSMDGDGNIALMYSLSSENTYPALRYTGRRDGELAGVMTQGEHSIIESTSSNGSNRWGDYHDMSVDPVDDCTFWTVGNYVVAGQWRTRLASFRFASCGAPDTDGDGIIDDEDNCPLTANADQLDVDNDTVGDVCDNCLVEANTDQCNTNAGVGAGLDQIGNICDADVDNNGIVNTFDLNIIRGSLGATGPNDSDITCDGIVNSFDITAARQDFGLAPGPSGIAP